MEKPLENTEEWTVELAEKDDSVFQGKLFVLTSVNTYSSAKELAGVLSINHLAMIIGEPSSNTPNSYGNCVVQEFKSRNFQMQVSTGYVYLSPSLSDTSTVDIPCPPDEAYDVLKKKHSKIIFFNQ